MRKIQTYIEENWIPFKMTEVSNQVHKVTQKLEKLGKLGRKRDGEVLNLGTRPGPD